MIDRPEHDPDPLLTTARARADAGAWGEVRALLGDVVPGTAPQREALLGEACLRTGDAVAARRVLDAARPGLRRAGDATRLRTVTNMLGAAAFALGALDDAREAWEQARTLAARDGDALTEARATANLGAVAHFHGDVQGALSCYRRALAAYARLGVVRGLAECWHNAAISLRTAGDLDAADDAERRAIVHAREVHDQRLVAMATVGRAEVALRRDDAHWARAAASRALVVLGPLGDLKLVADAERVLGDALARLGDPTADGTLLRALATALAGGHAMQEAEVHRTRAEIAWRRGRAAEARTCYDTARATFTRLGATRDVEALDAWWESRLAP